MDPKGIYSTLILFSTFQYAVTFLAMCVVRYPLICFSNGANLGSDADPFSSSLQTED